MNLTDEEIRIKVAEARGWKHYGCTGCAHLPCICTEYIAPDAETIGEVPNYPEDLNACAEFEATLTDEEFEKYRWLLWDAVKQPQVTEWNRAYLSAKAHQRCIAYLKTKGIIL